MNNSQPKIFLSYCSKDGVLARLFAHIFKQEAVECFLADRDLPPGQPFDTQICVTIRQSSLFLVLWSSNSLASPWVNQEIGIAIANHIPIWPIAVENISLQGPIFRTQGIDLRYHADPYTQITTLAREITSNRLLNYDTFSPDIDQYVLGKEERTKRLVDIFRRENAKIHLGYQLRMQGAFTSFSISSNKEYRAGGYHTTQYHELLAQEMQNTKAMALKASMKVVVWPRRVYDNDFMKIRFQNLVSFLKENRDFDRIRFVIGEYHPGSLYIFDRHILVEGHKTSDQDTPGYHITTVTSHGPTIQLSIASFDSYFRDQWQQHATACGADAETDAEKIRCYVVEQLMRMCNDLSTTFS